MARILDQVLNHERIQERLLHALHSGRLPSTLLFVGPSGVGKKMTALGLAQALLCEKGVGACGSCGACLRVEKKESESLCLVESTEIQIKIEQVRQIKDFARLKILNRARVAIIDEAHKMTPQAANSLLKILEEPPPSTYFILVSGQEGAILPTLRSRCQTLRFSPLSHENLRRIRPAPDWSIASSQGRVDRLEDLSGLSEIRDIAVQGFSLLFSENRFEAMTFFQTFAKEKDRALQVCQCWQQLVRDIWYVKCGQNQLMNPDLRVQIENWAQADFAILESIAQAVLQLERDILMNVDRVLSFESFWIHFSPPLRESVSP